jgi:hypothetical protein
LIIFVDSVFSNLTKYNIDKLQKAQNNCIRFIANLRRYDHVSENRERFQLPTLESRRKIRYYTCIHKLFMTKKPNYLYSRFTFFATIHNYQTRNSHVLWIPPHSTGLMASSFTVTASKLWNVVDPLQYVRSVRCVVLSDT